MHARSSTKLGKCHIVMFATAPETAFSQLCSWSGALHARHACAQACTRKICLSACAHAFVQACPRALAATSARGHASSGDVSEQLEGTPRGRRQLEGAPRGRRRLLERRCRRAYGNASMPAGSACADAHTRGCKRARMRRRQRRRGTTAPARPRACQHPAVPAGWQRHRCLFCPLLGWRTGNRSLLRWRPRLAGSWPAATRHAATMRQSLAATRLGPPGELPPGPRRGRNKSS